MGGPLGHDYPLVQGLVGDGVVYAEDLRVVETRVSKRLTPYRRGGQGMVGTVRVGKPPPAIQLTEGEVHPTKAAKVFERDQLTRWGKQVAAVGPGSLPDTVWRAARWKR